MPLNTLQRDEEDIITEETRRYLRDLTDHTFQRVDLVEAYREITSGLVSAGVLGGSINQSSAGAKPTNPKPAQGTFPPTSPDRF